MNNRRCSPFDRRIVNGAGCWNAPLDPMVHTLRASVATQILKCIDHHTRADRQQ